MSYETTDMGRDVPENFAGAMQKYLDWRMGE